MSVEVLGGLSSELPEGEINCQRFINANIYKIFLCPARRPSGAGAGSGGRSRTASGPGPGVPVVMGPRPERVNSSKKFNILFPPVFTHVSSLRFTLTSCCWS